MASMVRLAAGAMPMSHRLATVAALPSALPDSLRLRNARPGPRPLKMTTLLAAPLPAPAWKSGPLHWLLLALAAAALLSIHWPALDFMVATWHQVEEYSYGYFIPVITAFLIWQRSDALRQHELSGSWWGLAVIVLALLLGVLGQLSAIRLFSQYGFVIGVFGLSLAAIGVRGTRIIAVPLAMLMFMIPLPQFLLREVSHSLQLVSSQLGVGLIRLFGISVFLEGNVIDLGSYKLQVVEACSGLRYLFPLMVLGCLAAYFFQAAMWKRMLLVLSTVPLTIGINSLRIGIIGVTVEYWGAAMAEGLLHDLEGWFMFMVCLVLLLAEMVLLARLGPGGQSLRAVFGLDVPEGLPKGTSVAVRKLSGPTVAVALLLAAAAAATMLAPQAGQKAPPRKSFSEFPLQLPGGWQGRVDRLAPDIVAMLAVDDYFVANYQRSRSAPWVNFYTAYYGSQSGGESTHSPRTCIPGDGWAILRTEVVELPTQNALPALRVNRALIQKGDQRQLVYYWFQQRGRSMTGEFEVKWFILRDSLVDDRSDGALIRLVTPLIPNEDPAAAEVRLQDFVRNLQPHLAAYIPD
jgi:exosortase D (VPLPA-CTERM-specific)